MSLNNPKSLVTEERLHEFYSSILPYLGGMPEMVANKFSKGDLYSTEEKMIGQWIDGKPLYQIVIPLPSNIAAGKVATSIEASESLNIDTLIYGTGIGYIYDGNSSPMGQMIINGYFEASSYYSFSSAIKMNSTGTKVILSTNVTSAGYKLKNVKVILQYTKTTDSAISIGDDTDYSTEEKIVGTWIDGSPIYQKTFQLSNFTIANTESLIDIVTKSELNMDKLVSYEGVMGWNNADIPYTMPFVMVTSNGTIQVDVFCNEDGKIQLRHYRKSGSTNVVNPIVTLQYTKTT